MEIFGVLKLMQRMTFIFLKIYNFNFRNIFIKALRLIVWYFFIEAFLHFIHANAVVGAPFTLIGGLTNYEGIHFFPYHIP